MSVSRAADFWEKLDDGEIKCVLCPHYCEISEGEVGKCGARANVDGALFAASYGLITSIALDPIEKKPLYMFNPGKMIVSLGGYGCNFSCPFCQNYGISLDYKEARTEYMSPELLCEVALLALAEGNIGLAYTYNEPIIAYEFVKDCCTLIKQEGLLNVLVTNGYICSGPLEALLPYIDAINIDIKGSDNRTYTKVGGKIDDVKRTLEIAAGQCHVEVTTLVVPDENVDEIEDIAKWLSSIDPEIPYHLSRFYPRYRYSDKKPTSKEAMYKAYDIAGRYLKNVFLGNI